MYKTNDGYYHFEDDLRNYPNVWVYAVWSRRGPGKTYSALKWAYENKIPFIYMKRTDDDVDIITMRSDDASDFDPSPYAPINRDLGTNIKAIKLHKGFGAFYEFDSEGHPYGNAVSYIISFNQIKKYKGFDFSRCEWICFDEFIPQPGELCRKNEGEKLLELYMTVARDRQKRGKDPLKLVLFANAEEISTPVTNTLDIVDQMADLNASGKSHKYIEERDILLHHITLEEVPLKEDEMKGIYKGMIGTAWHEKAFGGEFTNNDFTNVSKRTLKRSKGFIHLHYKTHDYYIYLNQENGMYYMTSKPIRCMFEYNLNRENEQKRFWLDHGIDLRFSCIEEKMKFERYTMYDLIMNYKKFFAV